MARAEPVLVGINDCRHERDRRRSLLNPSTTTWVLVTSCRVVMDPWRMPKPSCTTLTTGARQLVVQEEAVSKRWLCGS